MEPEIRYARTSDGLSIAYCAMGRGLTLIVAPPTPGQTIETEWNVPARRSAAELSSRFLQYVRYDPRGVGASEAYAGTFTIDVLLRDLEAVADAVSPDEQIAIVASGPSGPIAIAYAARHPERLAKLVLWSTAPVGSDMDTDSFRRLKQLGGLDWDLAMESVSQAVSNFDDPQIAREFAAMFRSLTPAGRQTYLRFEADLLTWDVTSLLPAVQCPTLVMHPSGSRINPVANARRLAAGIPGRGCSSSTRVPRSPPTRTCFGSAASSSSDNSRRGLARQSATSMVVVLFVDIVNSTGLTEQWGDAAFRGGRLLPVEPEIRYARTSDGLNIAYYAMGQRPHADRAAPHARCANHRGVEHRADALGGRRRVPRSPVRALRPEGRRIVRRLPRHLHDRRATP